MKQQGHRRIGMFWLVTVMLVCSSIFQGTTVYGSSSLTSHFSTAVPELKLTGVNQVGQPLELVSTQVLGEGVVTGKFKKDINGQVSIVHLTTVDLNNPFTEIVALYGQEGKLTPRQNVRALAQQKEDVVAAVNADFFHMNRIGTPFGIVFDQGELISSMGSLEGWHSLGITRDRQALIEHFRFGGQVKAPTGAIFPIFGVNKEPYGSTQGNSHENRLHLYTPAWGKQTPVAFDQLTNYVRLHFNRDHVVTRIEENEGARTFLIDEQILWGHGQAAQFLKDNFQVGDQLELSIQTGAEAYDLVTAVGGHALLVEQGQARASIYPNVKGVHARSAVGISQDGKTVYFLTVEQNSQSKGMTLEELARVMVEVGAYKAANLDGGGSTTLVGRQLGEFELTLLNQPRSGSLRSVPTGIGVVNTAPKGNLAGIQIEGDSFVFRGDSLAFNVKAYDQHYHPYHLEAGALHWSVPEEFGFFSGATFHAKERGSTEITAEHQGVLARKNVSVLGGEDIHQLDVWPQELAVLVGAAKSIQLTALVNQGATYELQEGNIDSITVSPSHLGSVEGFTFTGLEEGEGSLTVQIDSLVHSLPIRVGSVEHPWPVLERLSNLFHTGHPSSLSSKGNFRFSQEGEPVYEGERSLRLAYNFEGAPSEEVRIAYGQLGAGGIRLPNQPLGLGIWIYGDNSKHWARALVTGADGKDHYIDLAKEVDWTGWQYTQGAFPSELRYPATLKSFYLVNSVEGQRERPLAGEVYFDGLSLHFPYGTTDLPQLAPLPPALSDEELVNPFKDLESHWSKAYVLPLAAQGIIQGMSATEFSPEDPITRAQLATLLDRTLAWGYDSSQANPYQDDLPSYAERSILAAHQHEVMQAFNDGTFRPHEPVSRAQLALYLHRALQSDVEGTVIYQDQAAIPEWAREAVTQMNLLGILEGDEQNRFLPDAYVTRAQVAAVLYRLSQ